MSNDEEMNDELDGANLPDDELTTTPKPTQMMQNEAWGGHARRLSTLFNPLSRDAQDAAAILHRLYSNAMFWHSLCWPGGIFFGSLLLLLFTYLADGCEAWASDKTVIA